MIPPFGVSLAADKESDVSSQAPVNATGYGEAVTPLSPRGPTAEHGTQDGSATASQRLADLPVGRRCPKCQRMVFVEGSHCPKPCGAFLPENSAALVTGKRSRLALRQAREAILERWRAKYRVDGHVPAAVDSVLKQLSRLEAISDRSVKWSEGTAEPITSARHSAVHERVLACADRIARLHLVLDTIAPSPSAAPSITVTFGGRWRDHVKVETDKSYPAVDPRPLLPAARVADLIPDLVSRPEQTPIPDRKSVLVVAPAVPVDEAEARAAEELALAQVRGLIEIPNERDDAKQLLTPWERRQRRLAREASAATGPVL